VETWNIEILLCPCYEADGELAKHLVDVSGAEPSMSKEFKDILLE